MSRRPSLGKGVYRVTDLVEKPPRNEAPSDLAIIGRYILTPDIFAALHETTKDKSGEIQLTNGLRLLLKSRPIYAYEVDGVRHDTGNKLGFLKANVYFALKRPDLAEPFREYSRRWSSVRLSLTASVTLTLRIWFGLRFRLRLGLGLRLRFRFRRAMRCSPSPSLRPRVLSLTCA